MSADLELTPLDVRGIAPAVLLYFLHELQGAKLLALCPQHSKLTGPCGTAEALCRHDARNTILICDAAW